MDEQLDFITMGMFIIDEIHFAPPRKPEIDVLGGAGSWSVMGARLFREPPYSRRVGWIVHKGSDFPKSIEEHIRSWDTSCNLIDTPERLTTRGWNNYGDDEARAWIQRGPQAQEAFYIAFKYTTPKLRIDQHQLNDRQLSAKCFHLICTPTRCIDLVEGINQRRKALNLELPNPIFVWEPVPDACKPEELDNALKALQYVDVVSPNHQELAGFFGETNALSDSTEAVLQVRKQCERLIKAWSATNGAIVVRCGERGCFWLDGRTGSWYTQLPYHRPQGTSKGLGEPSQVVDPTGAGNAFLGGLCVGLVDDLSEGETRLTHAVYCGLTAASFAIEQVGLPSRSIRHGQEEWNGDVVERRLKALESTR